MRYRIVKNVHLERDPQLTETGYHLGYRDKLDESLDFIISEMSTDKEEFLSFDLISEEPLEDRTNLINVVRYTELSQVKKDREQLLSI